MRYALVTATAFALSACAPMDASGPAMADGERAPQACFTPSQIVNFRQGRSQMVYLRTARDDVFEVSAGGCYDLGNSYGIAIAPSTGISDRLCVGDSARIALSNPNPPQGPCQARVLRSLTPAEIEALPPRDRP